MSSNVSTAQESLDKPSLPSGPTRSTGRVKTRPAGRRWSWRKAGELAVLLGPATVLFLGFVIVPIVVAIYHSFYRWNGFAPVTEFVGLHNYNFAIHDPDFRQSVVHNLIIVALSLIIQLPLSVGIAMLLNRRMWGRGFMRLVVFTPYVLAEATVAVIWLLMLQPDGFVDQILHNAGLGGLVQDWLADQRLVLYTLFVVITWKYIGFGIIVLLAGLQGIPAELREAAAIDGAGAWNVTRRITLPLLGPTIRIWVFLSVIGSLQLFDLVWIMTTGGPANASNTMAVYMIDHGFRRYQFGYGSAVAVILFLICLVFSLLYQRFALRRDVEGALTRAVG